MINQQLIHPTSIVVVGASNDTAKPGGKLFYNLRNGTYNGELYAINPRESEIQGRPSFASIADLPDVDLAFIAIPAKACLSVVSELAENKGTKAFVIVSAGFSEETAEGGAIEKEIVALCNRHRAALIGPNCIGVMTPAYQGVFTLPIPRLEAGGCDFVSGSGATAVFILETGLRKGLTFNQVFSVGNSAMLGVEEVLKYMDETYDPEHSSRVKLIYFESIKDPQTLLKHAASLIRKGCRIAAVKSGTSDAGSRAASSHTGAMANSDQAVDALFRKAGIVRCQGREDLVTVASVMLHPELKGRKLAVITHAGGPAVMLTDALSKGGLDVPHLQGPHADALKAALFPGSSVANPIDILATGTAEQLGLSIDYCENYFEEIDGMVVIFGTPGLVPVFDAYDVLDQKMRQCSKPIYPVLPSLSNAAAEVAEFLSRGHVNFPDEVLLGEALGRVVNTGEPVSSEPEVFEMDTQALRRIMTEADEGYLLPDKVSALLDAAGIPRVAEGIAKDEQTLLKLAGDMGFPLAMKVVGPIHKSDLGGVALGISDRAGLLAEFDRMKGIEGFDGVLLQPMLEGMELFAGAKYEPGFGHLLLCGMGGIFVESLKDFATGLSPLRVEECMEMLQSLRSYPVLQGTRGRAGIDIRAFAELLSRLSVMLSHCPGLAEMDLNPIMASERGFRVVDARVRLGKPLV
ncbi:MAG: CoA ligase [Bacteroidetes bacterium]|nr:MAG: CoA ligase [Bacteroidota bacterium]